MFQEATFLVKRSFLHREEGIKEGSLSKEFLWPQN
jgi:hypothetical protein